MLNISKHSGTTRRHRHKMIVVLLILLTEIHMCYCVHAYYGTCKPNEECTVLQWKEWGTCRGNCRNPITQVRKRPICADPSMVQPFTRANVKKYCNITQTTEETRSCTVCPTGIYSSVSEKCEMCG